MEDTWNPDNPEYGKTKQRISEVVNTNDRGMCHSVIASGAEFGIRSGIQPGELRKTFESSLQRAQQERESVTGR